MKPTPMPRKPHSLYTEDAVQAALLKWQRSANSSMFGDFHPHAEQRRKEREAKRAAKKRGRFVRRLFKWITGSKP